MRIFILALQFLTRFPINKNLEVKEGDFAKGVVYFPLIGLIVGAFDLGVYYVISLAIDGLLPLVCCLIANVAVTGALHIDGLADTCDGIFSSRTRERMLEIMKDSRIGSNGTIAIIADFLLKLAILASIGSRTVLLLSILLAPVAAKTMVVLLMYFSSYAREKGLGGLYMDKDNLVPTITGAISGIVILLAFLRLDGTIVLAAALVIGLLYRNLIFSKIQGMTGDTLGAANEVIEITLMLSMLVLWRYGLL